MGAKATKAVAAKNMARRADQMLAALEPERQERQGRADPLPATRRPCGRTPLTAEGLSKAFGSLEVFTGVDLAVDRGAKVVVLGLNGAGKTTLLRLLAGAEDAGHRPRSCPGHGLRTGYFAQEHDTLDMDATVWENVRHASPDTPEQQLRTLLGSFMFSGDQLDQRAGTLSGGERTRLALAGLVSSAANVLLLDEPTNNLDPASREQVLDALRRFDGRRRAGHARPRCRRGAAPRTRSSCCPTAPRTSGRPSTSSSSSWPDPSSGVSRSSAAMRRGRPGLTGRTGHVPGDHDHHPFGCRCCPCRRCAITDAA